MDHYAEIWNCWQDREDSEIVLGWFSVCVEGQGERGEWFDFQTGVKQGCNMSEFLFGMAVDWMMRKTVRNGESGIRLKLTSNLDDLDVADDVALLSSTRQNM